MLVHVTVCSNPLTAALHGPKYWDRVGAIDNRISDIEISADNNIYVGIGILPTDGVYKSATGNAGSWTKLNTGANGFATTGFSRVELACAPSNASVLYALLQSTATMVFCKFFNLLMRV
ncbi:MAG: hypothetical protein IPP71_07320 [Bacteroidetes bacterium]|nr:hypothetical protein [Bacteroidota bacterium]